MNSYSQNSYREMVESLSNKKNRFNQVLCLIRAFIYAILSLAEEINNHAVITTGRTYNSSTNTFKKVDK